MRRRQIVALCVAVGAAIAAAITPGVIADPDTNTSPGPAAVPSGFTIDRVTTQPDGSTLTVYSKGGEIKPGEPGWVDPPPNGEGQTP
jgi:hypothetical protein